MTGNEILGGVTMNKTNMEYAIQTLNLMYMCANRYEMMRLAPQEYHSPSHRPQYDGITYMMYVMCAADQRKSLHCMDGRDQDDSGQTRLLEFNCVCWKMFVGVQMYVWVCVP